MTSGPRPDATRIAAAWLSFLPGKPSQSMLRANVVMAQALGFLIRQAHDLPGGLSETLEHSAYLPGRKSLPPAYFWCTACLLTASRSAIAFHVQPLARAFSTCSASSTSTRPRRAATAARPTSGSRLLVSAAIAVTSSGPAGCMRSRYVDRMGYVKLS